MPPPFTVKVDNQSAITLAEASIFAKGLRHVNMNLSFINDEVKKGNIALEFVVSKDQLADIFTKPLKKVAHQRAVRLLLTEL